MIDNFASQVTVFCQNHVYSVSIPGREALDEFLSFLDGKIDLHTLLSEWLAKGFPPNGVEVITLISEKCVTSI